LTNAWLSLGTVARAALRARLVGVEVGLGDHPGAAKAPGRDL